MSAGELGGIRPGAFSDDAWLVMVLVLRSWPRGWRLSQQGMTPASSLRPSVFEMIEGPGLKHTKAVKGGAPPE